MNGERYQSLMKDDADKLTTAEMDEGWHFCSEFDGLLVGPGMGELKFCRCLAPTHEVYKTIPFV